MAGPDLPSQRGPPRGKFVPVETRGRAFAFYDILWNAARLLSLALGGILAEAIDVRAVYVISAALLLIAATVGLTTGLPQPPLAD